MTRIPLPERLTRQISDDAMRSVQANLRYRGWRSANDVHAAGVEGGVGLRVGVRYMMYQSRGTRPYLMTALEGRVINIDGNFLTVKDVGKPGYVHLPGGIRKWRDQKWRHPGLRPQRFLEFAITGAIHSAKPQIRAEINSIFRRLQ
ncbi:conserved hypothetical protein [Rhodococcus phage E3]|uniref:hypothetical protein n=1 Tax=Rhodococcus phage E3 TaxID=1007869 RepID=UPI0002C69D29|nr:hypothetical protein M176_gp114 [Rhodococcus phage E3]AEQ21023.1 conserved hypothetical protein [Rhodococcus phage E3]